MVDTVDKLLLCLAEAVVLLRDNNELRWAEWFEQVRGRIDGGNYSGVEQLGTAFGGMGSFNDLVLQSQSSQQQYPYEIFWSRSDVIANERLSALRTQMYGLFMQIEHERN